jgi:hypothetical protein
MQINPDDPDIAQPIFINEETSNLQDTTIRTVHPTLTSVPRPIQDTISLYVRKPLCNKKIQEIDCSLVEATVKK